MTRPELSSHLSATASVSRWPAIPRWIEIINLGWLERLERFALRSRTLQRMLLRTHGRALRSHLPQILGVRTVKIVGGGLFPRTAILLRQLLPDSEITIVDASRKNIETSKAFLDGSVRFAHEFFNTTQEIDADLAVIPLSFVGDRDALYRNPPAPILLIHDWLWSRRGESVVVTPFLLKRLNLVRSRRETAPFSKRCTISEMIPPVRTTPR